MEATNSGTQSWTFTKKVCFRFFFCFFIFQFFLGSVLYVFIFGFSFAIYNWFEKLYAPLYGYINNHFLHLKQADTRLTINGFLFHLIAIAIAIIATILWSAFDKKRKSYTQADFWLRHTLKYILAIIIFSYGIDKLIPDQMPTPAIQTLDMPVRDFTPDYLFWTLMGSHTFYESFTGLVEIMAAFLLVFQRTYIVGLIVLTGALINVLMLNIGFYIGVTHMVIVYLATCIYLLFPYLKSIIYFLLKKKNVELYKQPKPSNSKLYKAIFILSSILFIVSAIFNTRDSLNSYTKREKRNETTRTYNVTNQTYNSDTLKMVLGDKARWKYWIEYKQNDKNYLSVLTMNDTVSYNLLFDNDTINKVIRLKPEEKSEDTAHYTFSYSFDNKKGDQTLTDSLHKMTLIIKEFKKEDWVLLKSRNKFFPFDF